MDEKYFTFEGVSENGKIMLTSNYVPRGTFRVLVTFIEPIPVAQNTDQLVSGSEQLSTEDKLDRARRTCHISDREYEILLLVHKGYTNKRIAEELELGDGTVRNYISSLLSKVKATNRTQLINLAINKGLIIQR